MTVLQDIQQLNAGNIVTLYQLDMKDCIGKFGQTPYVGLGNATVGSITSTPTGWTAQLTGLISTSAIGVGCILSSATNGTGKLFQGTPTSCIIISVDSETSLTYKVTGGSIPVAGTVTGIVGLTSFAWCDGVNELGKEVVFDKVPYQRYPIQATGFDKMGNGTIPRPKLIVSNIGGIIGALTRDFNDLVGAKLIRMRTFARYLDASNFSAGNTLADPTQILDREIWTIDRKANENSIYMEWELCAPFDIRGVKIPRRQCVQNMCNWRYRSAECSYTGTNYFDVNDNSITDPAKDICGKRLSSCKKRFGTIAILPYGGFPGVGI